MRYAAKRTWPDRPKAWEHQGEADNLEDFALAFAADRGLGEGSEFIVLDKDSEDATLESFRVNSTDPYTLGSADARTAQPATGSRPDAWSGTAQDMATDSETPPPFVNSAASFMFYMVKIAVLALVVLGTLFYLLKQFNLTPPA